MSENTTSRPLYSPEFGLSLHIQCGSRSILFDAGCTGNFARNAKAMGTEQYARLKAAMGDRVSYLGTGRVIEL